MKTWKVKKRTETEELEPTQFSFLYEMKIRNAAPSWPGKPSHLFMIPGPPISLLSLLTSSLFKMFRSSPWWRRKTNSSLNRLLCLFFLSFLHPASQDQPAVMPVTRAASPLSTLLCKILSIFSQSWFSPHSFFPDNPGLLFFYR